MTDMEILGIAISAMFVGWLVILLWAQWDAQRRARAETLHRIDRLVVAERAREMDDTRPLWSALAAEPPRGIAESVEPSGDPDPIAVRVRRG